MSKRQRRRSRIRNILASIEKERETFWISIENMRSKAQSDVANARNYAGEAALNRIIEKSFARGDRDLFYRGVMDALDAARYDIGMKFGELASQKLFEIDPAIQMRKHLIDSLIHQAALSIETDTMAYPEQMVHRVRITIPPIERSFEI